MQSQAVRILVKTLTLVFLVGAIITLNPLERKTDACSTCVTLDPGSAIKRGCMTVRTGDLGCTPINGDACLLSGTWCTTRVAGFEDVDFEMLDY
jgi:hypothetical protein